MIKKVDNGHRRHKCSICGRVRFEKKMTNIARLHSIDNTPIIIKTRYGNECWFCVDNPDCQHKSKSFQSY